MILSSPKLPTEMRLVHINEKYLAQQNAMSAVLHTRAEKKALEKRNSDAEKQRENNDKRMFVIDFKGDIQASRVEELREEITALLSLVRADKDKVVVRLESPGGMVHGYGLAAAQLARVRSSGVPLVVCVDKVAASGGYMMACIANEIIAAPFAILGSIGVVAQVPNFNKVLKRLDVDYDVYTAGQYKRTVTILGENTDEGKTKFKAELEQTHVLFKDFVGKYRSQLDLAQVTTGEHWYGEDAIKHKLVDRLQTSDDYIVQHLHSHDVYALYSRKKPTVVEKLGFQAAYVIDKAIPLWSKTLLNVAVDLGLMLRHK